MRVVMSCGANSGRSKFAAPGKRMVQVFLENDSRFGAVLDVGKVVSSQVY